MKGGKLGLNVRRKGALERLEIRLAEVKAGKWDKEYPDGYKGIPNYKEWSIARMEREIATLKSRIYN